MSDVSMVAHRLRWKAAAPSPIGAMMAVPVPSPCVHRTNMLRGLCVTPKQPVEEVLRWRERDQIRQIKEPERRHIRDTSRFGDAELADLGRSQPE